MYTFSSKLKTFSFVLMAVGLLGIGYGFLTAPKTIQDVEKILAEQEHHGGGHGEAHGAKAEGHEAAGHEAEAANHEEAESHETPAPAEPILEKEVDSLHKDTIAVATDTVHAAAPVVAEHETAAPAEETHTEKKAEAHDAHAEHQKHLEHVLHQLQNKPWAAFYVACIFFMLISLGVLAFYGIQQCAQAGWSPVLFRVMQGITAYLPVASVIFFIFLVLSAMHMNHMFPWMAEGITEKRP